MNCEEVRGRLIEAVYGEVPLQMQAAFEEHLAGCSDCRVAYERLEQTDKVLDLTPDETARVDISALYREAAARGRRSSTRWRRVAMAAAAALLLVSGMAMWRGRIELGPNRLVISWRHAAERPGLPQPAALDPVATLAGHARHLATLDETIGLLVAELDASERQRIESLTELRAQIQGLQLRNNTRIDLVRQDIRDLYLASFSSTENEPGGQP